MAVRGGSNLGTCKLQSVTAQQAALCLNVKDQGKPELPRVGGVALWVQQRLCYRTTSVPRAGESHDADTFLCHEGCHVLKIFMFVMSLRRMNKNCLM